VAPGAEVQGDIRLGVIAEQQGSETFRRRAAADMHASSWQPYISPGVRFSADAASTWTINGVAYGSRTTDVSREANDSFG
jgi:hypothetical protein